MDGAPPIGIEAVPPVATGVGSGSPEASLNGTVELGAGSAVDPPAAGGEAEGEPCEVVGDAAGPGPVTDVAGETADGSASALSRGAEHAARQPQSERATRSAGARISFMSHEGANDRQ